MAHSHGHSHNSDRADVYEVPVPTRSRAVLLITLVVFGVATVIGLIALWPDPAKVDDIGSGSTMPLPGSPFPTPGSTAST